MGAPISKLDQLLRQRAEIDDALRRHQTAFSVLFTDVVGSTSYFEQYGDIAGLAMLTRHEDLARKAISERGGRVIKNLGDSVMAEFPDALSAAKSAVDIQRRLVRLNEGLPERERIQLRIGINHGIGFRHEGDVYGDVVNVAARITKRTGPAQILVSTSVQEAVAKDGELRCNWLAKVEMKGKAEQGDVYEIVWTDTHTYMGLRQNVTMALKRGDLMAPGLDVNELVQTSPPTPPPVPPAPPSEVPTSAAVPIASSLEARYEMLGELGSGGMGVVYKARDRETNDLVAIKMLRPEIAANEKGMLRFKNELRVARRITHKNVCRIHEFNRTDNSAYITMEFVEGESLRHLLTRFGSLGFAKGVDVASQICSGLREAHAQGVVHRDLKPENVMLDPAGNVKVMDFGIAHAPAAAGGVQLTQTQAVVGTPSYMSPEQALGNPLDHRSDIYALGLILYEIFTGSPTFTADTAVAIAIKHIREAPVPPRELDASIPEPINEAILKCLEKDPTKRFQNVDELKAALAAAVPADGAAVAGRTGEVLPQTSTPPPMQAQAYYAPTPYAPGTPPSPLPPVASRPTPAPQPPVAVSRATQAQAPVARPAAPVAAAAPAKSSSATVGIIIAVVLVLAIAGSFAVYKLLRGKAVEVASSVPQSAPPGGQSNPENPQRGGPAQPGKASEQSTPAPGNAPVAAASPVGRPQVPDGSPAAPPVATPAAPAVPVKISVNFALAKTLAGHTAPVSAVAFSADGRHVVTGSRDKTVRVWEAGTGQLVQTLKGHRDAISTVAYSPDGQEVASGSQDKTVIMWNVASGQPHHTLPKETGFINCVTYSADGRLFAYSTSDGVVKVFDAGSGEGISSLEGHTGPVYSVSFSPDGRWLASAGRDQTVRIWSVSSGQQARSLQGHADAVNTVLFSPDGRWLATASDDKTVKLWEASSGREVRTFSGHSGGADGLAFSPDGRWLAAGSEDKTVIVWDTLTGDELTTLTGHLFSITDLAVTRNGRWLASAAGDNTVRIWRRE